MKTYFIRHSSKLDVDKNTIQNLWNKNLIGIHYPQNKNGKLGKRDSRSTDPNDYVGKSKSNIKILNDLAFNGGYVYSVFRDFPKVKIGIVKPNSKIQLFKGKWGKRNNLLNREAILKVVKLTKVKILSNEDSVSFNSVQPRQGTICVWSKVDRRVMNLVNGKSLTKKLNDLTPDQQEVMCMEFLRLPIAKQYSLPEITTTLTPIGRTMKDVDIFALSKNNKKIICQVSFEEFDKSSKKFTKLLPYATSRTKTIYFCDISEEVIIHNVKIFPISKVFDLFCKKTKIGKLWLKKIV